MKARRTCGGVNPLRPVSGFFKPRCRSRRTASIISFWSSRKSEMACSSGSRVRPCWSNSQSAKLIWDIAVLGTFQFSFFFRRLVPLALQSFDIAWCGLEEQFLQGPPVVQTTAHLGDQFFRNVHGKTAHFQAPIEDVARVLLAGLTSAAVFANARAAAQAKRAQHGGPEIGRFALKPAQDIGRRCGFSRCHVLYVPYVTHTCQEKNEKNKQIHL